MYLFGNIEKRKNKKNIFIHYKELYKKQLWDI